MLPVCNSIDTALTDYYKHFLLNKKMGLVDVIAGSSHIKMGVGKSWAAIRKADLIDPDFHNGKIVYEPSDFLRVMKGIENDGRAGQVVIVDEAEVTAPAALWYSVSNRMISYTLATFRTLRCMSVFVTPAFGFLDRKVRILTSHIGFCNKDIGTGGKPEVTLRTYRITTDLFGEKIFFGKIWMYNRATKEIVKFNKFKVQAPREELTDEYEKKAGRFKSALRDGFLKECERYEKWQKKKKEGEDKTDLKKLVDIVLKDKNVLSDLTDKGKVSASTVSAAVASENLSQFESACLTKLVSKAWRV